MFNNKKPYRTTLSSRTLNKTVPGNYTCELEWAGAPLAVTHSLTVLQPPSITRPAQGSDYHRGQGGSLGLHCLADGDPRPQVWWSQRAHRTLQRIETVRGEPGRLELSSLTRNMTGEFVCQARNSVGTAEVNIHLYVNCESSIVLSHPSLQFTRFSPSLNHE